MRVYLAGPEVFLADAVAIGAAKRAVCARHGLTGVFPLDAPPAGEGWRGIYATNEALLRGCDALIGNLTPFRGPSADPGTVFELGLMRGLGRPVCGYSNSAARFGSRTLGFLGAAARRRGDGSWEDAEGLHVENFDLADNLMLEGGIAAAGGHFAAAEVPAAARWRDLGAFERCVVFLATRARPPAA